MEKHANETKLLTPTVWKNSLASFGKLILSVVFVCVYLAGIIFAIFPSVSVKISDFFGLQASKEASLVEVYDKSGTASSLYNLIVFEQSAENYESELDYINLLVSRSDYSEFCEKLDSSGSAVAESKSMIAYLCNTKSYIINQKIKCMWISGLDETTILTYIYSCLSDDYLFEYGFTTYVEYVYESDLELDDKQALIKKLLETSKLEVVTLEELLEERISDLENLIASDETQNILAKHTLMNLWKGKYYASLLGAYEGESETISENYSQAKQDYYQLLV